MGHIRALLVPVVEMTAADDALNGSAHCGTRSLSRRRLMPCEMSQTRRLLSVGDLARRKGHHGRQETTATVRGAPGGVRPPEAPGGVSPVHARVPRLPPRDRSALAILRPLRDTVGHALPRLRQPVATARCACLPPVWRGITTGPALRRGRGCQAAVLDLCLYEKHIAYLVLISVLLLLGHSGC